MSNVLRVLTYNIHKGFSTGNRQFVLPAIRDALQHADADLILLQEVQGEHVIHSRNIADWPGRSQYEFLADPAWEHHVYTRNAIYERGHHGNAILSRYPLIDAENINVSPYRWASRSVLHATVSVGGDREAVHVICIHFGLLGEERRRQLDILCDRIESHVPADAPLLVAGDFNDWLGKGARTLTRRLGLSEAFNELHGRHARSWPSWLPLLRMDRIYYRGLEVVECERLQQPHWGRLSDHLPLQATFTCPGDYAP